MSFKYKTIIIGKKPVQPDAYDDGNGENVPSLNGKVFIPLKYLCNVLEIFDLCLINCVKLSLFYHEKKIVY